ncbi:ABC transporter permease [Cupriavidus oxalaticus]|jgi:peptide/nickel transport system permease protein|uniref:ABC transporter permease n=1 Tax=Cupriavidus oxalaticus TaxID=96344 RepID=A0A976BI23_9BURK|nr:ABC transporter permease [Cupriavidus oxalaticus]QRQ84647.1 ABC transporter permease [Cupriavidus oxalaticus]QRQ91264.1 ABC transporter permease [Cupriavidus oxalaticus]WQD85822.1 ABC transporter permease [Cupriavidus oxalaticus]SPC20652.1 Dipeptide transport protein 1 (ABC superfamily, membrane) [Cupriavidus oxalaticus]
MAAHTGSRAPGWQRLLQAVGVVAAIAVVNFFLLRLAPGDAAQVLAGEAGAATPEYLAALRAQFGLDQPLWVQLGKYLWHLARLDLGFSFRQGMPVLDLILQRLPATLLLMGASIAFAVVAGATLGVLAAARAGRLLDTVISTLALLCFATPLFWTGLMLVLVFSVWLDWLPVGGMFTVESGLGGWAYALDVARHLLLPAVTLGLFYMAVYVRLMRASMIEMGRQDFVRTAVAKGAPGRRVLIHHVLRNALLPLVTMVGVQASSVIGGAVVVETVFSWPGLGRTAFDALYQRDYNLLLGILLCSSVVVIVVNAIVDLVYARIDPRIRLPRQES